MISVRIGQVEIDEELIQKELDEAKSIGARRVGFQTREIAMNSIKDGAGPSPVGSPPNSHVGTLRRFIGYEYDKSKSSVVVGPRLLTRRSKDAAEATEKGGQALDVKGKVVRVLARPFMSPAFQTVQQQALPAAFTDTFR